jgi:formate dehydrogenase major subunit
MSRSFLDWPVLRQLTGNDPLGRGPAVRSAHTEQITARTVTADRVAKSVCPYCAVGCAMMVHTIGNEIVNIEGDPRSPHNEGCLCPKGAATYQLLRNPNRATRVLHRKPGAGDWEEVELDWAMDRIAELVKKTRDETFVERLDDGTLVNQTTGIFALGGATLDNEWNHMQQKLMRGLGAVAIENQARI